MIFLFRKIGKFLRGSSNPFQIYSATLLAGWLAFTSNGFGSIGLGFLLFAAMVILNANLFVAGMSLLLFKVIFWGLLPVLFQAGIWLLHGPMESLVGTLSSLPILAWFGLDLYVQVPGLILGTILGSLLGFFLVSSLRRLRQTLARLENDSAAWEKATQSLWVRSLAWVFLGGLQGKKSWGELAQSSKGSPVRPLGMVIVALSLVLGWVGWQFLDTTILTTQLQAKLEPLNGATVDIGSLQLEPGSQQIILENIAFADPEDLGQNRFEASRIILNLSGTQFLAKRAQIDSIEILGGAVQTQRSVPAVRIYPPVEELSEKSEPASTDSESRSVLDYLEDAQIWKSRLEMAARWIERLQNLRGEKEETDGELSWREQLALQAQESGYASVAANHWNRRHPRLIIRELKADPIRVGKGTPVWQLSGGDLASEPASSETAGWLQIAHTQESRQVRLTLPSREQRYPALDLSLRQLSVDDLRAKSDGKLPLKGGSLDFQFSGAINPSDLALPANATLYQSNIVLGGNEFPIRELKIPVEFQGSLRNPKIKVDQGFTQDLLKKGVEGQIQKLIEDKAGDQLKKLFPFGG